METTMAYQISEVPGVSHWNHQQMCEQIEVLLHTHGPRYRRLWAYYRNPMRVCGVDADEQGSERPYRQAQEWGLPSRITGARSGQEIFNAAAVEGVARKEVVIENDIAWRVDTIVDYLFGKPIVINSAASDPQRRDVIGQLLRQVIAHNGGIVFLQQIALLGAVYGYIDVLVKFDSAKMEDIGLKMEDAPSSTLSPPSSNTTCGTSDLGQPPIESNQSTTHVPAAGPEPARDDVASAGASTHSREALDRLARRIRLEIVEPARALPLLSPDDYRCACAYAQVYQIARRDPAPQIRAARSLLQRLRSRFAPITRSSCPDDKMLVVELITPVKWQRYEDEKLVAEGANSLGRVPLVHIQNTAVPFEYSGASEVEPLMAIQDELNAKMSDRAYRITMQSFKMYLGKGIEDFMQMPVAPGRMWLTDNENADIVEFGGDSKTFSEDNHIADIRQAMDKISGVTPIAAGALKGRIGRLTSAAALRVTMLALLAKTERKRTAYSTAIEQMCEMALDWLDRAGLFSTTPEERRVEIHWPSPIPVNEVERLEEAQKKVQLGVPQEIVLRELGY
jgi:hypothetical protein